MTKFDYNKELPRVAAWERVTEVPLTIMALVFLVAYAYPILVPDLSDSTKTAMHVIDLVIWVAFAVDYFGRLTIATKKWRFIRHNLVDLMVVVLPPTRPLRLLRVVLLLVEAGWRHVKHRTRARLLVFVSGTAVMLIFLASLAILDAERGHPDAQITNFGDALWWAVVSATTVGYGDFTPVTVEGRIVALSMMFIGIGLIGFITGSVTSWVIDKVNDLSESDSETQADVGAVLTSVHTLRRELTLIRQELTELRAAAGDQRTIPAQSEPPGDTALSSAPAEPLAGDTPTAHRPPSP